VERAKATEIFARTVLSFPYIIGYDYFMFVDQPPEGISKVFPENSNYGIVNNDDEPYPLMVKLFTDIQHHPAQARMATIPPLKPVVPREHKLYDEFLAPHEAQAGNAADWHLQQNGPTEFSCDNGLYHIFATKDKPMVMIEAEGKPLARFCALTQYLRPDGSSIWNDVNELVKADISVEAGQLTAVLTARYNPVREEEQPFEMTYRLVLPAKGEFMLADVVEIRNTGTSPLRIKGVFLRFFANFDGKPEVETDIRLQLAPRVWNAPKVTGWLAPDSSRYLAFACEERAPLHMNPWHDEKRGTYHPDFAYYLPEPEEVAPNAAYRPDIRMYIMALYGHGNLHDGQLKAFKLWR
jgi:hypothetical protein